jgi:CRP-like cAMP-binding protein
MPKPLPSGRHPNRLLAALPDADFGRLAPHMRSVRFEAQEILTDPVSTIRNVYFPRDAVASMLTVMEDGSSVEVATVGNEGMIGLPVFLGTETMPVDVLVQIPGEASVLDAAVFLAAAQNGGALRNLVHRYTQALLGQIAQAGACSRLHSVDRRCARWLLMSHDRVNGDEFLITHESLSQMLGVRRATVTEAASILQRAGLIAYRRGRLRIVDRGGLEEASCECYRAIRSEYERLIGRRVFPESAIPSGATNLFPVLHGRPLTRPARDDGST